MTVEVLSKTCNGTGVASQTSGMRGDPNGQKKFITKEQAEESGKKIREVLLYKWNSNNDPLEG